ncbi:ferredoxin [Scopulibacillus darangshiensis]|uniref:Ferredoxin n=1 Tax=Scopulibacillus darangshiensis TaxID=442528 RepID=A0A4R2NM45_9BACL|nr:ferredoxin [Scopulibacillus darangshiensis]
MVCRINKVFEIRWEPTGEVSLVSGEKMLLHSLLENGIEPEFDCQFGHCGSCMVRLVEGEVSHNTVPGISQGELDSGLILLCSCCPVSRYITLNRIYF